MKFYQVHRTHEHGESCGSEFFTSKAAANAAKREWMKDNTKDDDLGATITEIEITPTKAGILRALNRYAGHADNG